MIRREGETIVLIKYIQTKDWHSGYPITEEIRTVISMAEAKEIAQLVNSYEKATVQRDN